MRLPANHLIRQVRLGELRATLIGPQSRLLAKMALVTNDGEPVGSSVFAAWSPRTLAILQKLKDSMEQDFAEAISSDPSEASQELLEEEEDELAADENDEFSFEPNPRRPPRGSFSVG